MLQTQKYTFLYICGHPIFNNVFFSSTLECLLKNFEKNQKVLGVLEYFWRFGTIGGTRDFLSKKVKSVRYLPYCAHKMRAKRAEKNLVLQGTTEFYSSKFCLVLEVRQRSEKKKYSSSTRKKITLLWGTRRFGDFSSVFFYHTPTIHQNFF